jgi:hypothetical protein
MGITEKTSSSPPSQSGWRTYHSPADVETAEYTFRNEPSNLQKDPDIAEDIVYRITPGARITENQLKTCAAAFSKYYGLWSNVAPFELGAWAEAGRLYALWCLQRSRY